MLRAETNAEFISAVAARPDVQSMLGGELSQATLEAFVAKEGNMVLANDHGAFLIDKIDEGVCEVHMLFHPRSNGAELMAACRQGYKLVEANYKQVYAFVPDGLRAVAIIALRIGFKRQWQGGHPHRPDIKGAMYLLEF